MQFKPTKLMVTAALLSGLVLGTAATTEPNAFTSNNDVVAAARVHHKRARHAKKAKKRVKKHAKRTNKKRKAAKRAKKAKHAKKGQKKERIIAAKRAKSVRQRDGYTAVGENDSVLNVKRDAGLPVNALSTDSDYSNVDMTKVKSSAIVSEENEIPMTFKEGLLVYNASADHSERVAASGLTQAQKQKLNNLSIIWLNSLRSQFYQNPSLRSALTKNGLNPNKVGINSLSKYQLHTTDLSRSWGTRIGSYRTSINAKYAHTIPANGMKSYNSFIVNTTKGHVGRGFYLSNTGENLYQINSNKETMLQYEVDLYNKLQGMTWGEYNAGSQVMGGHLNNALCPSLTTVSMAFESRRSHTKGSSNPDYYVTWEFAGKCRKHSNDHSVPVGRVLSTNVAMN